VGILARTVQEMNLNEHLKGFLFKFSDSGQYLKGFKNG